VVPMTSYSSASRRTIRDGRVTTGVADDLPGEGHVPLLDMILDSGCGVRQDQLSRSLGVAVRA
jgi:hypothetical protein